MESKEFRKYGHQFIDWLSDYFDQIEQYPVVSRVAPGDILAQLPASPPAAGESMETIFSDFQQIIVPGMTHWQHPGWFAYFPANSSPESVLAELLTAGLGSQCMVWQTSPAAAELEERVMQWLAQMLGLPGQWHGVIQDTASTSTLSALISARERVTGFEVNQAGFKQTLRVYASCETHSSIEKGVKVAGYGKENLRLIDTDENFAMRPEKLEEAIQEDIQKGYIPACVVATLGSTSSMAMDPVDKLDDICKKHRVWLHVDAAYAGTAAIAPEFRAWMKGVDQADSFVFNPHKWMLTNFDCSAYFVKDKSMLIRTFEIHPEYLKTAADKQVNNYRDWGIQLGRRFRALKLWFVLRSYGVEGLRHMVRSHVAMATEFATWIEQDKRFEFTAPPQLSLVCFRYNPGLASGETLSEDRLTAINKNLLDAINTGGDVFLSHTVLNGKYTIRLQVGQRNTTTAHVRRVWEIIQKNAKSLTAK